MATAATAAVLVVSYAYWVSRYRPVGLPTNHSDISSIIAERYLYDETCPAKVLIGSSLVYVLPKQELRDVYNLGMPGHNPTTGLEVVTRHLPIPKLVIVETTMLPNLPVDQEFLQGLFAPHVDWLRARFTAFRTEYKPALVLHRALSTMTRAVQALQKPVERNPKEAADFLIGLWNDAAKAIGPEKISEDVGRLRRLADAIVSQGASIKLLEMPVDPRYAQHPIKRAYRERLLAAFPTDRFEWIEFGDSAQYETFDGFHVQPKSGAVIADAIWRASTGTPASCAGAETKAG